MRQLATAEIIAVGSELLTPHRTDTNSLYLTAQLNELGIDVRTKCVVGDNLADLVGMFKLALTRADVVLLTGGLGPTADDMTRDGVAAALNLHLHESAEIVGTIQARFASRGLQMPEINRRQARVPEGARVLPNANGTAPGLWIDTGEQVVVLLPGPPRELQPIFERHVRPGLANRTGSRQLRRRILKITGRPESGVEQIAQPLYGPMADWPMPIETTILAAPGQIELHLSARGDDVAKVDQVLDEAVVSLAAALGDIVFSVDGRSLPEVVGQLLLEQGARVAVAESCTGGLVLGRLTDVPGSSSWVIGGVTAYSNDVKIHQLGVAAALIADFGAVSEPVARAMADGVRERLAADVSVSVTGIAGPAGGTAEKPVGTVVIATSGPRSLLRTFRFPGDRAMVRTQATQAALDMLRRTLMGA
jgi:competence/damage-inducible protein CinA-like protein